MTAHKFARHSIQAKNDNFKFVLGIKMDNLSFKIQNINFKFVIKD